ncbi:uncharacterized protein [Magallana gigas]|uniref:uncharacterized protein n=1 Tax=Magallana gigas TaxID=29159 RepID=UPI0033404205
MNEAEPYGGLVYGYNDSMVAIWLPQPLKRESNESAAVFMLGRIWGWNFKTQMTNNVDIVLTVMDVLVPICLLEVNTSTTHIDSSFQYESYNNSVLKFAYGDEITLTCKRGYKVLDPTVRIMCNPEHNGAWSRTFTFICRVLICLLEVNTSTTHIDSSFQYESYNNSVLEFANGDEITLTCKRGYKVLDSSVKMMCNPEHNGTWSRTFTSICRASVVYSFLIFHCSQKLFVRILL